MGLIGKDVLPLVTGSKKFSKFFRLGMPFCIGAKTWLWYRVHMALFHDQFSHPAFLALILAAAAIYALLVMVSSVLWGIQIMITLGVFALTLSHKEISDKLQMLKPVYTDAKLNNNTCNNEGTIKQLLDSINKLLLMQARINERFNKMTIFICLYYVMSIVLFGYGSLAMLLSKTDSINASASFNYLLLLCFYSGFFYRYSVSMHTF